MIELGREVPILVARILIGAIHGFKEVDELLVHDCHSDALLLQGQ